MNASKSHNLSSNLYWDGDDFRVSIVFGHGAWSHNQQENAIKILDEFRTVCQRYYFAHCYTTTGLQFAYERFKNLLDPDEMDIQVGIGSGPPDAPQKRGRSTIGHMRQGELLDALQAGGEFRNIHAKAFIVFVYHLWDDAYRDAIADTLSIKKNMIECTLMGDLRLVRNLIIHKGSVVPAGFSSNLEFLPAIWNLLPGNLTISSTMIQSLMEQLNAIRLTITPSEPFG